MMHCIYVLTHTVCDIPKHKIEQELVAKKLHQQFVALNRMKKFFHINPGPTMCIQIDGNRKTSFSSENNAFKKLSLILGCTRSKSGQND